MKPARQILLPVAFGVLAVGICAAQNWFGPGGGRRGWNRDWNNSGPIVQTEGGQDVNEDTVRTARQTANHSGDTPNWTNAPGFEKDVFTFTRIIYKHNSRPGPSWTGWVNDYPDSDLNLSWRLQGLTSMKVDPDGLTLKLTDPEVFRQALIYMVQPGRLDLRDEEVPILRKYLLSGGTLLVDDFWGDRDWMNFENVMKRVLPEKSWTELPPEHPIFHFVFDLKKSDLQVPTIQFWERSGSTYRGTEDTHDVHVRAWLDDHQHIMVLALHNSDNGDGWEREGEDPEYFREFSEARAYPLAINVISYIMTH